MQKQTEKYLWLVALRPEGNMEVSFWHTVVDARDEQDAYSAGYKAFKEASNRDLGYPTHGPHPEPINDYVIALTSLLEDRG